MQNGGEQAARDLRGVVDCDAQAATDKIEKKNQWLLSPRTLPFFFSGGARHFAFASALALAPCIFRFGVPPATKVIASLNAASLRWKLAEQYKRESESERMAKFES